MKKTINEDSFKAHYPSLKKLVQMNYTDPRTTECNIKFEREGIFKNGDDAIKGSYVVYEEEGFHIGVHVSSDINEDSGDPSVNVIAIDKNPNAVTNRVLYRIRRSKNVEEKLKK